MRTSIPILLIFFMMGCQNETPVSLNPFIPNIGLKTDQIYTVGFDVLWVCDGGYNTYSYSDSKMSVFLFEDCLKPGNIIGEQYNFIIDSTLCDSELIQGKLQQNQFDSLTINIDDYQDKINNIISFYGANLNESQRAIGYQDLSLEINHESNQNINCRLAYNQNKVLILEIETWYR